MGLADSLRRFAKGLNHRRLARRTAARARSMGLSGITAFAVVEPSPQLVTACGDLSVALSAFGLGLTQRQDAPPAAAGTLPVFGPSACAGPVPSTRFGLWLVGGATPDAAWLAAARVIWVPGVDDVRRLNGQGVPSSKVYVMPAADAPAGPGAGLFTDRVAELRFHVGRFLLAHQVIGFDAFFDACAAGVRPLPDTVCLGVAEYPERLDSFRQEGWTDIAYFPGLRHNIGWIGCGLSYKFLMKLALRDGRAFLAVCEDDVELPADWRQRVSPAMRPVLAGPMAGIDLFSGLITELPPHARMHACWSDGGVTWATLDHTVGMVFNVYRAQLFAYLAAWREDWTDLKHNAIDRHLERKPGLRVATTLPFLAGHKEGLTSTLWGAGNAIYVNRFEASRQKLQALLDERAGSTR